MSLPVVELDGEAYEQGRQHGLALREQIAQNLSVYYDRFEREAQLPPEQVRARAGQFVPVLQAYPDYWDAMRGVADASGQELIDVVVLNARYELLYYQYSIIPVGGPDGCTSFAVTPEASANGHLLIGENWDWIPEVAGAILHARDDGFSSLAFTEAGIVGGKIGLNSAGLGLAINGLLSTDDDWSRPVKPFHVRCYEILRSQDFDTARRIVTDTRRACSANFILAQAPDRALTIEAGPDTSCSIGATRGLLAHTNHFLDTTHLGVEEPPLAERRPQSHTRLARMQELLDARAPLSAADLQASLRDHDNFPDSVCRHIHPDDPPEEACPTVVSVVMDLTERKMWLAAGQPCEHVYEEYQL